MFCFEPAAMPLTIGVLSGEKASRVSANTLRSQTQCTKRAMNVNISVGKQQKAYNPSHYSSHERHSSTNQRLGQVMKNMWHMLPNLRQQMFHVCRPCTGGACSRCKIFQRLRFQRKGHFQGAIEGGCTRRPPCTKRAWKLASDRGAKPFCKVHPECLLESRSATCPAIPLKASQQHRGHQSLWEVENKEQLRELE